MRRVANFATVAMHYLINNVYKSRAAAAMPIKKQIRIASPPLKEIVLERAFFLFCFFAGFPEA